MYLIITRLGKSPQLIRFSLSRNFQDLERQHYYLVAISMYVCVKGAILGLSHANQVRVKSVPDGPKATPLRYPPLPSKSTFSLPI